MAGQSAASRTELPRRRLGRSGMEVTELALGTVGIGGYYGPLPEDVAVAALRRAAEIGINYVDTSPHYKEAEARIGRWLRQAGGRPAGLLISTKTGTHPTRRGDYSADATRWSVENSLQLTGAGYFDCVLIHDPRSMDELEQALAPGGAVEELARMKGEGKVRSVGLGVREHEYHRRAVDSGKVDVILTYADYTLVRQTAASLIEEAAKAGVGVILAQLVHAGQLAGPDPTTVERLKGRPELQAAHDWWLWARERGVSLPALAIQFGLRNPYVGCALVGAQAAHEVEENVRYATEPIPDEIWREVDERIKNGKGQAA
jgi:aryl-alcohol dehydrogenase-like predicted oxidoreductase